MIILSMESVIYFRDLLDDYLYIILISYRRYPCILAIALKFHSDSYNYLYLNFQ